MAIHAKRSEGAESGGDARDLKELILYMTAVPANIAVSPAHYPTVVENRRERPVGGLQVPDSLQEVLN